MEAEVKCFCGGTLHPSTTTMSMVDIEETFRVAYSYCDKCSIETYTEEQKVENAAIVKMVRESCKVRDLEQEAIDFMKQCSKEGMLIPEGYEGDHLKFERDFRDTGKVRIMVGPDDKGFLIACSDMYDRIGLYLDEKQEEELLVTLQENQKLRESNLHVTQESLV